MLDINKLWGKLNPWESLPSHMKKVGDVAVKIITDSSYDGLRKKLCEWSNLSEEELIPVIRYLSAMHDVAKAHPSFQIKDGNKLPEGYEDEIIQHFRHEQGVFDVAEVIWEDWDDDSFDFLSTVLSLHHQHNTKAHGMPLNDKWKEVWHAIDDEMRSWSGFNGVSVKDFSNVDAFCTILTGLIILSDWIASSNDTDWAYLGLDLYHHEPLKSFEWNDRFEYVPRTSQQEVMDKFNKMSEMPLMVVVEAPPGEGKTELALWLAHKMGEYWGKNGIYFGLPTAATSNQMVERVRRFLGEDVTLMHLMAWLEEEPFDHFPTEDEMAREEWKRPSKKAILSRYAVGTVDQIMMSVLKVRYGSLRLFGLSNKVVIIDEIHAYDAYMTEIIKRMCEWFRELRIPVIMLSATLPAERKKTLLGVEKPLKGYPLTTCIFENGKTKQFVGKKVYRHMTAQISLVRGFNTIKIPTTGMNCILVNTVEKAQKIYDQIEGPKILFHSQFTSMKRAEIEKKVLELYGENGKRGNMTLVATQVVEQSLDVDFDYLITELAPVDLIFQRLGRLHRFDIPGRGKPKCTIFCEWDAGMKYGKSEYLYHELLLERTDYALKFERSLRTPSDIRNKIEKVYSDAVGLFEADMYISRSEEIAAQRMMAEASILNTPSKDSFGLLSEMFFTDDDELSIRTRLGTGYKLCILPEDLYNDAMAHMEYGIPEKLARKINEYCIPVIKEFDGVNGKGRLAGCRLRIGTASSPLETSESFGHGYKENLKFDKEKGLCLIR